MSKKLKRRRGDDLLENLYDATFALMDKNRHSDITFQQIAEAAKTSRTVLYRRWSTMFELLEDVYAYKVKEFIKGDFLDLLNFTGDLREDLNCLLKKYRDAYVDTGVDILNNYFYLKRRKTTAAEGDTATKSIQTKEIQVLNKILTAAKKRGNKTKGLSPITLLTPFKIIQLENLISTDPISDQKIEIIVNEILLPIFLE